MPRTDILRSFSHGFIETVTVFDQAGLPYGKRLMSTAVNDKVPAFLN